ncbi:MAG: vWA domain-containing protein [Clostridium sp.]
MNNGLTEIIFLLDRSGSMCGLEKDTIGGYNSFLQKQKELGDNVIITTILFDDKYEILYNGVNINEATLNSENYYVRGCTALLDAIGKTILLVKERKSKGDKVIFVITTDGMENASCEFRREKIKNMISNQEKKYGWEFLFFGANIDVKEEGDLLGIDEKRRFEFNATCEGYSSMMEEMNCVIREIREEY